MRRLWCACGASVEAEVQYRNDAYEAEFFDPDDLSPVTQCSGCDEELYPAFCEGTLSEIPPERRPQARLRLARSR